MHSKWTSVLVPAVPSTGACWLCILFANRYGLVLFCCLPVLNAFLAAFCHSFQRQVSFGQLYEVATLSILITGVFILVGVLDGILCLAMALPLALLLAVPGAWLGGLAGKAATGRIGTLLPLIFVMLFPCLVAFEDAHPLEAKLQQVTSSVEIDGPIDEVWKAVIAFPEITRPPEGIFRLGIAYPIRASIDGTGVGATRLCTFCTGDFVEPITHWEENRLLAFKVTASPPPMKEISIYGKIDVPHLHGHMASEKGQFRLEQRGDKVFLKGTTWYRHQMWPQWYWIPMTDQIIHKIHGRVLDHIRVTVEAHPTNPKRAASNP